MRGLRRVARPLVAIGVAAAFWAAGALVAHATMTSDASAATTVSTDVLRPPTDLAVTCSGTTSTLSWTVTPDAYAGGYTIVADYDGYVETVRVDGGATSSYSTTTTVPAGTDIYLTSVFQNWTSPASMTVRTTASCG